MSNIYIQEPLTSGKVILKTTVGDIEIELWAKEAPLASRNFIQLCMENYYNKTIFHRVVKDFIVQGGDPTGTGEGGDSIYGQPFKDEFHTRLRFCRRGLVAMANAGKDDNGSQFFFTLGATPELQNKHTIFGKVAGDTIYNMLKLGEALVDEDDRPDHPQKIISTEVLSNPFDDIVPRVVAKAKDAKETKKKEKTAAVKNFKLLSFGEEAEGDEEETIEVNKKFSGKSKSAHDNLVDPKLSSKTSLEPKKEINKESSSDTNEEDEAARLETKEMTDRIKNKLLNKRVKEATKSEKKGVVEEEEEEEEYYLGKGQKEENKKKLEKIKQDIRAFKRDVKNEKKKEQKEVEEKEEETRISKEKQEYLESQQKYKAAQMKFSKKGGQTKDEFVAKMLEGFKNRLKTAKEQFASKSGETENPDDEDDDSWLVHKFECDEKLPVVAKDASTKNDNWFEIDDPRNPINKRRRGETTGKSKKFKH